MSLEPVKSLILKRTILLKNSENQNSWLIIQKFFSNKEQAIFITVCSFVLSLNLSFCNCVGPDYDRLTSDEKENKRNS